jgi:hypothetical protein
MKPAANCLLFILAVAGAMSCAAHTNQTSAAQLDIASAQAPVAVVERFGNALTKGDLKLVGELLDANVLILESGGAERSREEYLAHHAISDAQFLNGTHSQLKFRRARLHGDLAWVGSESELHASKDGKPMTLLSTETMVLKKSGADWRIVHIHWSSRPKR